MTDRHATTDAAARRRLSAVVVGSVLMVAGVALVLIGCWYIGLGWALCENDCPAHEPASWWLATLQLAVAVVPGLLVGGVGWLVLSRPDMTRPSLWAGIAFAVFTLVAVVGIAYAISDPFPPAAANPPTRVGTAQQTGRDLSADELRAIDRRLRLRKLGVDRQTAADRAAHPIPPSKLRQAEHAVEARMQRNYPQSTISDVDCVRTSGWRVSCGVTITYQQGDAPSGFEVPGRYRPGLRTVDFRPW